MDFNLKMNADKSEMLVYSGSARPQIRVWRSPEERKYFQIPWIHSRQKDD